MAFPGTVTERGAITAGEYAYGWRQDTGASGAQDVGQPVIACCAFSNNGGDLVLGLFPLTVKHLGNRLY